MKRLSGRSWFLLVALAATVWLVITDETQDIDSEIDSSDQQIAKNQSNRLSTNGSANNSEEPLEELRLDYLVREKAEVKTTKAFSPSTWYRAPPRPKPKQIPAPPPPAPYVAPAPTAPPLPFKYFGSYEDGPKRIVLLLKGGKIYPVIKGDTIDGIYRVKNVVGSKIEIIYLPLGTIQSIKTGIKAFTAK
ncbi:MAG: hypothetical protein R8M11_00940 [Gallionella sp.]